MCPATGLDDVAAGEQLVEVAASVPGAALGVPATLQASLMARLDRLGPAAKEIAEIGAAIRREFPYELAAAVAELSEERLQEALQRAGRCRPVLSARSAADFPSVGCLVHDESGRHRVSWR